VATKTPITTNTSCRQGQIQILYEIDQIIPYMITTRTISEERSRSSSCSEEAKKEEESFQLAGSVLVAFALVVYCSYLNLYRHRKSFRRKPPTYHSAEWTGPSGFGSRALL